VFSFDSTHAACGLLFYCPENGHGEPTVAEILSLQIQANSSSAEESLKQVKKALDEGKQSAEILSHVLDGDLSEAFKSLEELGKTLGLTLDLAFSPLEIIAFVKVIADVADKLSTLIADTFIYTDEQKALDAQIRASNKIIADYAAQITALDDAYAKMGKTASQQTALDIAKLASQLKQAQDTVRDLTGDVREAMEKGADPNVFNAPYYRKALPGLNDQLGVAQQKEKLLLDQMRNLTEAFKEQQNAELQAIAEAEINGRLRVQEASVNAEKAKWDRIRELVHTSADQNVTVETGFENRLYQVKREALRERLELMRLDPDRNAAEITRLSREIEALARDHETALTRIKIEGDRERKREQEAQQAELARQAQQALKQAKEENDAKIKAFEEFQRKEGIRLDAEAAHEEAVGELKRHALDFDLEMGRISQRDHDRRMKAELEAERDAAIEILRIKQSLYDKDSTEYTRLEAQIQKVHDKTALAIQKVDQTTIKQQEKRWQDLAKTISSSISGALNSWIQGSQTLSQAWAKMAEDMAMKFISSLEQQLVEFVVMSATKESVDEAQAKKSGLRAAYDAAKKAWAWASDKISPFVAPVIAAATFAGVEAFGSAEGGQYIVPGNQLTMLHRNEMVLPAGVADRMRGVIEGGGGGGGVTVVVNHSVNAVDAESFQQVIRRHGNIIGNEVARVLKKRGMSPR
jgi:hypothetical protein